MDAVGYGLSLWEKSIVGNRICDDNMEKGEQGTRTWWRRLEGVKGKK